MMFRRLTTALTGAPRVALGATTAMATMSSRTFFGKGWDNASLDIIYRSMLRKPEVTEHLRTTYAQGLDGRTIEQFAMRLASVKELNAQFRAFLPPHIGDPHRLLKAYSLTAYPILDQKGDQLHVDVDGHEYGAFADPDDDYSKVVIPQLDSVEFLAQQLLKMMQWEATPRGAAALLESLYRGAEIPDHVFQTPAVIERLQ